MTCCSMYVGDLKGFRWKGGNWDGNIPAGLTSEFPPVSGDHYHWRFREWVEKVGVFHAQADFDGYVARVTKAQILEFIEFCYGSDPTYVDREHTHWPDWLAKLDRLRQEVAALDDGVEYGLVSECF